MNTKSCTDVREHAVLEGVVEGLVDHVPEGVQRGDQHDLVHVERVP